MIKMNIKTLCFTSIFFITIGGCSIPIDKSEYNPPISERVLQLNGTSDMGTAGDLSNVYFEKGSHELDKNMRVMLNFNVEFLKKKKNIVIELEGHADERENDPFALSSARILEVKRYLTGSGISILRITTSPIGNQKPIVIGETEELRAKNRRVAFIIKSL